LRLLVLAVCLSACAGSKQDTEPAAQPDAGDRHDDRWWLDGEASGDAADTFDGTSGVSDALDGSAGTADAGGHDAEAVDATPVDAGLVLVADCPDEFPGDQLRCTKALSCSIGEECCCGKCSVSLSCTCEPGAETPGAFQCGASDYCMSYQGTCPPQKCGPKPEAVCQHLTCATPPKEPNCKNNGADPPTWSCPNYTSFDADCPPEGVEVPCPVTGTVCAGNGCNVPLLWYKDVGPTGFQAMAVAETATQEIVTLARAAAKGAPSLSLLRHSAHGKLLVEASFGQADSQALGAVALKDGFGIAGHRDVAGKQVAWLAHLPMAGAPVNASFTVAATFSQALMAATDDGKLAAGYAGKSADPTQRDVLLVLPAPDWKSGTHAVLGSATQDSALAAATSGTAAVVVGRSVHTGAVHKPLILGLSQTSWLKLGWQTKIEPKAGHGLTATAVVARPGGWLVGLAQTGKEVNAQVLALDQKGKSLWQTTLPLNDWARTTTMLPLADGGLVALVHASHKNPPKLVRPYLVRVSALGQSLWKKNVGIADAGFGSLITRKAGGFLVAGHRAVSGKETVCMARTDAFGEVSCLQSGACLNKSILACDDADPCTYDSCTKGKCTHGWAPGCN